MTASNPVRNAFTSRTTLALFAFLALSSAIPAVVDVYASPVYWVLFTPSYLVTMVVYDGGLGLEALVYPVAEVVPVDGHLLWEAGRVASLYLFAVVVGLLAGTIRGRTRRQSDSATP